MNDQEQTRFRSFAERYVIERAREFKTDVDAWTCIQDAVRVYKMIAQQSTSVSEALREPADTAAPGATGPMGVAPASLPGQSPNNPVQRALQQGALQQRALQQRALQTTVFASDKSSSLKKKIRKVLNI
jgi:hypothetical protein